MMLITTLVVSFLVCCMLEVRCGQAGVVSGLQAKDLACSPDTTPGCRLKRQPAAWTKSSNDPVRGPMWPKGQVEVQLYSTMTAALEGNEWSAARPGRSLPTGKSRYPFYRRLGGPQGRSGRVENLVPTGIRSRTVQPVVNRYTKALACSLEQCPGCRLKSCFSLQPRYYSSLTAPNLQPTTHQERNDQCGNQHYSRQLLMMGIVVPETC